MTTTNSQELSRLLSHHRDSAHFLIAQVAVDGAMVGHAQRVIDQYLVDIAGNAVKQPSVKTTSLTPELVKDLVTVLENIRLTEWLNLGGTPTSLAALHTACKELEQGKI